MKSKLIFFAILILILAPGFLYYKNSEKINSICIENKKCFEVEVADNSKERQIGLSKYNLLENNSGMLFVFPEEENYGFWMKDMKFPIDIIWINSELKIVGFEKSVEPCEGECEIYSSQEKIKYVLEINSGISEEKDFEIGDRVKLKR